MPKMRAEFLKTMGVQISPEMRAEVEKQAEEMGVTMSVIIRWAIKEYLAKKASEAV